MFKTSEQLAQELIALIESKSLKAKKTSSGLEITSNGQSYTLPLVFQKVLNERVQINK